MTREAFSDASTVYDLVLFVSKLYPGTESDLSEYNKAAHDFSIQ